MKKKLNIISLLIIVIINSPLSISQNWFPLEIGNRWDYLVRVEIPGGQTYFDTLSIEIIDQKVLYNGLEYFEFSNVLPFWPNLTQPRFIRETNNFIFYYDEVDSSDCFALRFDLPVDTFYYNCRNLDMNILFIYSGNIFGQNEVLQDQMSSPIYYSFSENFGIYEFEDEFNLSRSYYELKGCIISGVIYGTLIVSVDESIYSPENFSLSQNYPNPFNPTTKIKYSIASVETHRYASLQVKLTVYDVLGNEVATLVNEQKPAGTYEVEIDGTGLPSGIYFYQLKAGEFVSTKKMILMK